MENIKNGPIVTYILIALNVIVFFLETIAGGSTSAEVAIRFGAEFTPYILQDGQWYRLLTSCFLHFGIMHIASNMFSLYIIGNTIESYFGKVRYIIIYLVSGIAGNVLTLLVEMFTGSYALSAGASGAISGMIGAMIVFAIDPRTKNAFPFSRMLMGFLVVIIPGIGSSQGNVVAHIGGLIGGMVTALIMYAILYLKTKNDDRDIVQL